MTRSSVRAAPWILLGHSCYLQMDYSGPPGGTRRQTGYDAAYYNEVSNGAYSQLFPAIRHSLAFHVPLEDVLAPRA